MFKSCVHGAGALGCYSTAGCQSAAKSQWDVRYEAVIHIYSPSDELIFM